MNTERHFIEVSGIRVEVVRKAIKNLHLGVYPPAGHVRVAVPERLDDEAVRLAVTSRLGWIRRKQQELQRQPRQSRRELVTGESHYVWGNRYRLEVLEARQRPGIEYAPGRRLRMVVRPGADREKRERLLNEWYRAQLKAKIPGLIAKWEPELGVGVAEWGVKRMRTRWGTCNPEAARIWINLELAKKPPQCLEYVIVHEMVHLLERKHDERFRKLMDNALPQWRALKQRLESEPLAFEEWESRSMSR